MRHLQLLCSVILLPLNQPIDTRRANVQLVLCDLQRKHSVTKCLSGEWRLFALLKQYRWWVHVDQL
ncbi:hypothetical protein GE191_12270 [Serratia fonticola]|nr:hypothetical protein [Serratia fonticola]NBJ34458.1 hypothetical protein [Serratia fonticola]